MPRESALMPATIRTAIPIPGESASTSNGRIPAGRSARPQPQPSRASTIRPALPNSGIAARCGAVGNFGSGIGAGSLGPWTTATFLAAIQSGCSAATCV